MRRAFGSLGLVLASLGCGGSGPPRVELSGELANIRHHHVAFDGEAYAVVWASSAGRPTDDRVWFARLSPAGEQLVPPTRLFDATQQIGELQLTAMYGRYAVWFRAAGASGANLFGALLDERGELITAPTDLGDVYGTGQTFAAAWTGERLAVASQQSGTVVSVRLKTYSPELVLIDNRAIETSTVAQGQPCITWSAAEERLIAVWEQGGRIRSMRIAPDGVPVPPSEDIGDLGAAQAGPSISASDTGLVAGWTENKLRLRFASSTDGGPWRLHPTLVPDNRYEALAPAMAVRAYGIAIAWASDAETALAQIHVGQLDLEAGTELADTEVLTDGRWPHGEPRVTAGTDEVAVTFLGSVAGAQRLYFTPVE